jgi:hypothetical protein
MTAGVCRYCRCTEAQACDGGCSWADASETICSRCQAALEIAGELVSILGVIEANPKSGLRLTHGSWDALIPDQQRLLVLACRTMVDGLSAAILEGFNLEAMDAGIELNIISNFLLEQCPEQLTEDEAVSQVVVRLLQPHLGNRIVLP